MDEKYKVFLCSNRIDDTYIATTNIERAILLYKKKNDMYPLYISEQQAPDFTRVIIDDLK